MKFACEKCHTKYSIADEKVRRKVLKIRCKTCGNVIEVRETGGAVAPADEFAESSTRIDHGATAAAAAAEMAKAKVPPPHPLGGSGKGPPPRAGEPADWHIAIEGKEQGPITRTDLVKRLAGLAADADVHIWREDLAGWKEPSQIPDIARDVKAARLRVSMPPGKPPLSAPPSIPPPPASPLAKAAAPVAAKVGATAAPAMPAQKAAALSTSRPPGATPGPRASASIPPAAAPAARLGVSIPPIATPAARPLAGGPPPGAPKSPGTGKHAIKALEDEATPAPIFPAEAARGLSPFPMEDMTGPLGRRNGAPVGPSSVVAQKTPPPSPLQSDLPAFLQVPAAPGRAPLPAGQPTPPPLTGVSSVTLKKSRLAGMKYAIVGLVVIVVLLGIIVAYLNGKPPAVATPAPTTKPAASAAPKRVAPEELAQKMEAESDAPPPVDPAVPGAKTVAVVGPKGVRKVAGARGRNARTTPAPAPTAAPLTAAQQAAAKRFADSGRTAAAPTAPSGPKSPASPEAIKAVFKTNQGGIKNCYDRALLRDRTLTKGRIDVTAVVGVSGRVKQVQVKTSSDFRIMEPCVKEAVAHWAFPASNEDYDASFPYIFQGG